MPHSALREIYAGWLDEGMKARGWNQTTLARQSGVSRDTIWRILKQESDASEDVLQKLSESLGRDLPGFTLAQEAPSRPPGPRSETEWWLDPSEIRKRQGALLELLAKFRQETAAYRAAGLVPSAEKVLDWLLRMEELAALPPNPPDRGSAPAGGSLPPTADPARR